jgi:hypothetical protein
MLTAVTTSIHVYTYARFAIGCNSGSAEFPQEISFDPSGNATSDPVGTGDIGFDADCTASNIHFPRGGFLSTQAAAAGVPFAPFSQLSTSTFTNNGAGIVFPTLSHAMQSNTTSVRAGIVLLLQTQNAGIVKLLFTYQATPGAAQALVSGGFEVQGGPPRDGF